MKMLLLLLNILPFLTSAVNPVPSLLDADFTDMADPSVMEFEGKLYIYPTADQSDIHAWVAEIVQDLEPNDFNFTRTQDPVFNAPKQGKHCPITKIVRALGKGTLTWAPHVYHDKTTGLFHMYTSVCLQLYVATSSSPLGPFVDPQLIQTQAIDPMFFEDDDGSLYLYYAKIDLLRIYIGEESVYVQKMSTPTVKDDSYEAKMLIKPSDHSWEYKRSSLIAPRGINEGPWMLKRDGTYYLMFSGAGADTQFYNLGYATSDSPDGTFTKSPLNPISDPQNPPDVGIFGPGHHAIWEDSEGKPWVIYHQQKSDDNGWGRNLCIDPLTISDEGDLSIKFTKG